jgi:MoxR-like ATPase
MEQELSREKVELFQRSYERLHAEISKRIVGYTDVIDQVLTAMFAGGHVLLEGVPGLGKTLMVRTISEATHLTFRRIQFTPDLMPADITGTNIIHDDEHGGRQFRFQQGPIFAHLVLADEINRATPKTQSAILEAMQEHRVTVGGVSHVLPEPFWVLATQNPIEMEGTYPLPEAQVDRFFFKVNVMPQGEEELLGIIDRTTGDDSIVVAPVLSHDEIAVMQHTVRQVLVADFVKQFAARIVLATHPENGQATGKVRQFVRYGVSPRGVQTLILGAKVRALLSDRYNVSCDDVREITSPALRHRIIRNFEAEAENISTDAILENVLDEVSEPAVAAAR